ncbi:MAG: hypothetical protein VW830_01630, partial [Rhodobiaceae bacterium]
RPAIDRQAELIITENKIFQHRAPPSFAPTLAPAHTPHKHRRTPGLVTTRPCNHPSPDVRSADRTLPRYHSRSITGEL